MEKKKENLKTSDKLNSYKRKSKEEIMKIVKSRQKYLKQDKIVNNQLKNQLSKLNLKENK